MNEQDKSLDLVGIGKVAEAIPEEVYIKTADTALNTFEKIIAPITESTSGLGRYIKQKFDNMVEVERLLLSFSMENAKKKLENKGITVGKVTHPKTIVKIIEEVSKETDGLLNDLWTNLLCTELETGKSHPFFINVLSSISSAEAILLQSINSFSNIGGFKINVLISNQKINKFITENGGEENDWTISCNLLLEFGLTATVTPESHKPGGNTVIYYRTQLGDELLNAVTN